jgi:hypothetical protein
MIKWLTFHREPFFNVSSILVRLEVEVLYYPCPKYYISGEEQAILDAAEPRGLSGNRKEGPGDGGWGSAPARPRPPILPPPAASSSSLNFRVLRSPLLDPSLWPGLARPLRFLFQLHRNQPCRLLQDDDVLLNRQKLQRQQPRHVFGLHAWVWAPAVVACRPSGKLAARPGVVQGGSDGIVAWVLWLVASGDSGGNSERS